MSRKDRIAQALNIRFNPARLAVVDESHRHAGHVEAPAGGESHYRVEIVSSVFADQSRLQRQRLVNEALADEFAAGMHALALTTITPDEDGAAG